MRYHNGVIRNDLGTFVNYNQVRSVEETLKLYPELPTEPGEERVVWLPSVDGSGDVMYTVKLQSALELVEFNTDWNKITFFRNGAVCNIWSKPTDLKNPSLKRYVTGYTELQNMISVVHAIHALRLQKLETETEQEVAQ